MDLREQSFKNYYRRHPWEQVRLKFFSELLKRHLKVPSPEILDCGSGDCWLGSELATSLADDSVPPPSVCFVDNNFSAQIQKKIETVMSPKIRYNFQTAVPEKKFDVVLMLDVLEHAEGDAALLKEVVSKCFAPHTVGLVSAPAFRLLWGEHDVELGHFRRYSKGDFTKLFGGSGLDVVESGYLFSSMVVPRMLENVLARFKSRRGRGTRLQVAGDQAPFTERLLKFVLETDLAAEALFKYRIPGLSRWVVCRKKVVQGG